ncbi:MAG TPA: hypothetical protein VFQ35_04935 [Polyangiaceae bacterium]|nr:hypothetical protein [Polyangiaceae bacterium]
MARAELGGRAFAWCVAVAALGPTAARAAAPVNDVSRVDAPPRIEVVLVGAAERDPALFERLRTLFPPPSLVILRKETGVVSSAVLTPERADTLYIWIRSSSRNVARVYLAAREQSEESARYLYREVALESGLDEIGSESLAQIAHSAAEALWSREQEISKLEVLRALAKESEAASSRALPASEAPSVTPALRPREAPPPARAPANEAVHVALGASFGTHSGGDEGWLSEPGAFVMGSYGRASLRLGANYLMPAEFELLPARVRLSGGSAELRAGWLAFAGRRARVRLEAGIGAWAGRWMAMIVADEPKAHANSASFLRGYGLAAGAFEWSLGSGWIAARAELRTRFRKTDYEVEGVATSASSSYLNPGAALELGVVLDGGAR